MIRKSTLIRALALTALLSATAGTVTTDAEACGGGWYDEIIEIDHRPRGLTIAEAHIDKGEYKQAAGVVIRMIPHIKQLEPASNDLIERAHRVLAVAAARSNGSLDVGLEVPNSVQDTWVGKTSGERRANLDWAIDSLRALAKASDGDPAIETDLAEALSKVDGHRAEAKVILERLAKKDLIATPFGYAALAELRSDAGDSKGQKLALERCEKMAVVSAECAKTSAKS